MSDNHHQRRDVALQRGIAVFEEFKERRTHSPPDSQSAQDDLRKRRQGERVAGERKARSRSADTSGIEGAAVVAPPQQQQQAAAAVVPSSAAAHEIPLEAIIVKKESSNKNHHAKAIHHPEGNDDGDDDARLVRELQGEVASLRRQLNLARTAALPASQQEPISPDNATKSSDDETKKLRDALEMAKLQIDRVTAIANQYLETGRAWQNHAEGQQAVAEQLRHENSALESEIENLRGRLAAKKNDDGSASKIAQQQDHIEDLQMQLRAVREELTATEERAAMELHRARDEATRARSNEERVAYLEAQLSQLQSSARSGQQQEEEEQQRLSLHQLQQVEDRLRAADAKCAELQAHMEHLEQQLSTAHAQLQAAERRAAKERERADCARDTAEAALSAQSRRVSELDRQLRAVREELTATEERAAMELHSASDEATRARSNEERVAYLEAQLSQLQSSARNEKEEQQRLSLHQLQQVEDRLRAADAKCAELQAHREHLEQQLSTAHAQLQAAERRITEQSQDLLEVNHELRRSVVAAEGNVESLVEQLEALQAEKAELVTAIDAKTSLLQSVDDSMMSDEASHNLLRDQLVAQAARLESVERQASHWKEKHESMCSERDALLCELSSVQSRCEAKDGTIRRLEADCTMLRTHLTDAQHDVIKRASVNAQLSMDLLDLQRANSSLDQALAMLRDREEQLATELMASQAGFNTLLEYVEDRETKLVNEFVCPMTQSFLDHSSQQLHNLWDSFVTSQALERELLAALAARDKADLRLDEIAALRDQLLELLSELSLEFENCRCVKEIQLLDAREQCQRLLLADCESRSLLDHITSSLHAVASQFDVVKSASGEHQRRVEQLHRRINETHDHYKALLLQSEETIADLETSSERIGNENRELRRALEGASADAEQSHNEHIKKMAASDADRRRDREVIESLTVELQAAQLDVASRVDHARAQAEEISRLIAELKAKELIVGEKQSALHSKEKSLTGAEGTIKQLREAADDYSTRLHDSETAAAQLRSELASLHTHNEHMGLRVASLDEQLHAAKELLHETQLRETAANKKLVEATSKLEGLQSATESKERDAAHLQAQLLEKSEQLEVASSSLRAITRRADEQSTQLKEQAETNKQLRSVIRTLEEKCAASDGKCEVLTRNLARKTSELEEANADHHTAQAVLHEKIQTITSSMKKSEESSAEKIREMKAKLIAQTEANADLEQSQRTQKIEQQQAALQLREASRRAAAAEISLQEVSERLALSELRCTQLAASAVESAAAHERRLAAVRSKILDEKRNEISALEKIIATERSNSAGSRDAQKSALCFVNHLETENRILEEKFESARREAAVLAQELHDRRRESAIISALTEDCCAQLGTPEVLSTPDLLHELMNRITLQLATAEHALIEQIQFDELIGALERHSATSSSMGLVVHRVFTALRRALDALQRKRPSKADAAANNLYKIQKAAMLHLEQQNIAVDRCVRSASEFNAAVRAQAELLKQHLKAVSAATHSSSQMRPSAQVIESTSLHKAYIQAKTQTLLVKATKQLNVLKELREAYSKFEDDFSRVAMQLIAGIMMNVGGTAPPPCPPTLVADLELKMEVFADGEEFAKQPIVVPFEELHAKVLRSATTTQHSQSTAHSSTLPVVMGGDDDSRAPQQQHHATTRHPPHHRLPSSSSASPASPRDADADEALRFVEQIPELEASETGDFDDDDLMHHQSEHPPGATAEDYRIRYLKVQKEKQRLYRLVRSLTKRLKADVVARPIGGGGSHRESPAEQATRTAAAAASGREDSSPVPVAAVAGDNDDNADKEDDVDLSRGSEPSMPDPAEVVWIPHEEFQEGTAMEGAATRNPETATKRTKK